MKKNNCSFCQSGKDPDYKEADVLRRYISDQGKIAKHFRANVCAGHQRKLSRAIKRARFLALLPFTTRIS